MAHDTTHDHDLSPGGAHSHHILPQRTIFLVFGALMTLMVITIAAAFMLPEQLLKQTFFMQGLALLIAVIKAYLVVTYFMGVKMATRLVKIFAIGGFVWFFTLFIMFADYLTRPYEPVPGWENVPSSALPRATVKDPE